MSANSDGKGLLSVLKVNHSRQKGKLGKVNDHNKLIQMWNDGFSAREIAKEFGVSRFTIYNKAHILALPRRKQPTKRLFAQYEARREYSETKVFAVLNANGGSIKTQQLKKLVCNGVIQRMIREQKIISVEMTLKRNVGDYKRFSHLEIFKEGYFPYRWICRDKTALVRLMQKALKKPKTVTLQRILRSFLRKHLTDAELFAVYWKLGIRSLAKSQVKSTIQIDGIVMARRTS